jgi:hypothetical protein
MSETSRRIILASAVAYIKMYRCLLGVSFESTEIPFEDFGDR